MTRSEQVALLRNRNWASGPFHVDEALDLMDANLAGVELGHWPVKIHEQSSHLAGGNAFFGTRFIRAKMQNASLQCVYFGRADFSEANLDNAVFDGCNLNEAVFRSTNLTRAKFATRDVTVVDPPRGDWEGDQWTIQPRVTLRGALFDGAIVKDADFSAAEFNHTIIVNTDLSSAKGLDLATHAGASFLSQDTLRLSRGKIPTGFLKGIGLQDWEIQAVQLYREGLSDLERSHIIAQTIKLAQPKTYYSVFISHAHSDSKFAHQLNDRLQELGVRCWLDAHQVLPGDDIHEEVNKGINAWDKVLLCCSKASLRSWWVDSEIESAFQKEQRLMKERGRKILAVIPLDLDGYMLSEFDGGKAAQLRSRLAADFRGWDGDQGKFDIGLQRLIRALALDESGRELPPPSRL